MRSEGYPYERGACRNPVLSAGEKEGNHLPLLFRTLHTEKATANAKKFMKVVRKYTSFEELTPTLLRKFVEKIIIHESESLDGKRRGKLRRQEIKIYYSFVGKVELPDQSPTRPAVSRTGNGKIFYTSFISLSHMSKYPWPQARQEMA